MSVAVETELELAHSTDLMLLYTPSNNPMLAKTTLKDARIHPRAWLYYTDSISANK